MIKVIKFIEKAWMVIAIATFLIAIYWAIQNSIYDALYFFGFSVIAIFLFIMRRKQRMFHEREAEKKGK
ncbi:hypothetical protein OAD50_05980 [Vicingaceae bacterium]|nr:hypothetical protein [Vicingaceae bacterium]MDB9964601.1 hypothetical protein [Vicingaceae bacterium]MDC1451512.1 hypothetical protein [Vicingaceae bacterium]